MDRIIPECVWKARTDEDQTGTWDSKSPWITAILKKRMNFRDRLKRKAIKTKDQFNWNQFRIVKNQVNWEINSAKKAYYENAFNNRYGD